MKNFGRIAPRERFPLSSPGSTGRPSIPKAPMIQSMSCGVLDTPHTRGMTIDRVRDGLLRFARNDG